MHYNPLSVSDRIEKKRILTNRIIVNALQSDRGDIIRVMNDADLKMMKESVVRAVYNKLMVDVQRAYDFGGFNYVIEQGHVVMVPSAKFELTPDSEIEEEVSAYFEINGKLQYRKVAVESIGTLEC